MNIPGISVSLALACTLCVALTHPAVAAEPASLLDGKTAADAVAKLTEKLKAPVRVFTIEIKPTTLTLQVQDPAAPTHINQYSYTLRSGVNAFRGSEAISGPKPVELHLPRRRISSRCRARNSASTQKFSARCVIALSRDSKSTANERRLLMRWRLRRPPRTRESAVID